MNVRFYLSYDNKTRVQFWSENIKKSDIVMSIILYG